MFTIILYRMMFWLDCLKFKGGTVVFVYFREKQFSWFNEKRHFVGFLNSCHFIKHYLYKNNNSQCRCFKFPGEDFARNNITI